MFPSSTPGPPDLTKKPKPTRSILLSIALLAAYGTSAATPVAGPLRVHPENGRSLSDDRGPFLGVGASCFQALRHTKFDRARLEANLALLAEHGFNYLRVLSMVGWDGLEIAPV